MLLVFLFGVVSKFRHQLNSKKSDISSRTKAGLDGVLNITFQNQPRKAKFPLLVCLQANQNTLFSKPKYAIDVPCVECDKNFCLSRPFHFFWFFVFC